MAGVKGYVELPLNKIIKAEWNYKHDDEERLKKLVANIRKNGQIENVIVRELDGDKYEMVNGNHRHDAFNELAIAKVMAFNLGKISLKQAKRIAIETNETRFESDHVGMAKIIAEILEDTTIEELASTMPFSENEIDDMQKLLQFNPNQYEEEETDEEDEHVLRFKVNSKTLEKWNRFVGHVAKINEELTEDVQRFEFMLGLALAETTKRAKMLKQK